MGTTKKSENSSGSFMDAVHQTIGKGSSGSSKSKPASGSESSNRTAKSKPASADLTASVETKAAPVSADESALKITGVNLKKDVTLKTLKRN